MLNIPGMISKPSIWSINHRFQLLLGEWEFVGYNLKADLGFAIHYADHLTKLQFTSV